MKENLEAIAERLVGGGFFLEEAVEILEKEMIKRALVRTKSNQSEASKILGIHRNTLQRKMVEYEIDGKRTRQKPPARAQAKAARRSQTA